MGQANTKLPMSEQIAIHQKTVKSAVRELEREKRSLERQDAKTIAEMKKMAKQNQPNSVKTLAKELARSRKYQQNYGKMRAQLVGLQLTLTTMKSQEAMTTSLKGITQVMGQMNKTMNPADMQRIMAQFMGEQERQQLTQEMMSEAMDDVMEDDSEEEDMLVSQVLDEIGIELGEGMSQVGNSKIAAAPQAQAAQAQGAAAQPVAEAVGGDDDLEARLNALKR